MSATVNDIVKIMDSIAPRNLAEEWDNAGFLIGRGSSSVKKIMRQQLAKRFAVKVHRKRHCRIQRAYKS